MPLRGSVHWTRLSVKPRCGLSCHLPKHGLGYSRPSRRGRLRKFSRANRSCGSGWLLSYTACLTHEFCHENPVRTRHIHTASTASRGNVNTFSGGCGSCQVVNRPQLLDGAPVCHSLPTVHESSCIQQMGARIRATAGTRVKRVGVYNVIHYGHRGSHKAILQESESFPECRRCGTTISDRGGPDGRCGLSPDCPQP